MNLKEVGIESVKWTRDSSWFHGDEHFGSIKRWKFYGTLKTHGLVTWKVLHGIS